MRTLRLDLKARSYGIHIGSGILRSFGRRLKALDIGKTAVIITNPAIRSLWGKEISSLLDNSGFDARFEEVADTEKSKSLKTCIGLLERIASYGRSKTIFIIALGGGVIGDLAGFAASIYKRGVPYIQVPTTLVAQVDSAIGGKTAVDLKVGKNLVGSFYQPRAVFSDIQFLKTLSTNQLKDGLSEIIKYGVIKGGRFFEYLERNLTRILSLDQRALEFVIKRASSIKSKLVEKDEFDRSGIRAALNYGHTIGHAVEAASGYSPMYTHGKAISIGVVAANHIANKLGLLSYAEASRIETLLKRAGLPVRSKGLSPEKIYRAHLYDKKFAHGKNRFVLASKIGRVKIVEAVGEKNIKQAIGFICQGEDR